MPKSFEDAKSDGERWRWSLAEAVEMSASCLNETRLALADFLHGQFGVQTMAGFASGFAADDDKQDDSGPYAVQTLHEDETIARLATGVKRFKLPDEFNFIKIYEQIADDPKTGFGEAALLNLAQVFENRRQYPRAADLWRRNIKEYGPGQNNYKDQRLQQIVGNWGRFEPITTQPAGQGATIEFRFRNGKQVHFAAHAILVDKLLGDVKAYLKSNPGQLNWQQMNIGDLGYRLVSENQQQYLGEKVAEWDLELEPRPTHFDKRITVTTPLQKSGAYLLKSQMADGNTNFVIIWVADTAIVKKTMPNETYYFVADAISGSPLAKVNLEFFGWQQKHLGGNNFQVDTKDFAEFSDADGQVLTKSDQETQGYQWLVIARGDEGRFAYLGFTNVWYNRGYDAEYNQTKVLVITDRPVYRPTKRCSSNSGCGTPIRSARTRRVSPSTTFDSRAPQSQGRKDPRPRPSPPTLTAASRASSSCPRMRRSACTRSSFPTMGGGNFRVEEYKKPEFEVKVDAPKEPVMLGEKITATIQGEILLRRSGEQRQGQVQGAAEQSTAAPGIRSGNWDWFYGRGYWWFASDYNWYPGWARWGCWRPRAWWWAASCNSRPKSSSRMKCRSAPTARSAC